MEVKDSQITEFDTIKHGKNILTGRSRNNMNDICRGRYGIDCRHVFRRIRLYPCCQSRMVFHFYLFFYSYCQNVIKCLFKCK